MYLEEFEQVIEAVAKPQYWKSPSKVSNTPCTWTQVTIKSDVPSSKQRNGIRRPDGFCLRNMTALELNNSISEQECLAVIYEITAFQSNQ